MAQGSPIFAWSDNEFLTASTGNDQFGFAQPSRGRRTRYTVRWCDTSIRVI